MIFSSKEQILKVSGLVFLVLSNIIMLHAVAGLAGNKRRPNRPTDRYRGRGSGSQYQKTFRHSNIGASNSSSSSNSSCSSKQVLMLAKAFRIMHDQGGTAAVLNGCRETLLDYEAPVMVEAALLAGNPVDGTKAFRNRGISSGILNALLGCCCCCYDNSSDGQNGYRSDPSSRAEMAVKLMKAYDDIAGNGNEQENIFEPDLVALCIAYVATSGVDNPRSHSGRMGDNPVAAEFLRRAENVHGGASAPILQDTTETKADWSELKELYDIRVLQDTKEYIVLSKPSGMVCYHGGAESQGSKGSPRSSSYNRKLGKSQQNNNSKGRRRKQKDGEDKSLEECLLAHGIPLSSLNQEGRGLVHRIDRGTSGCLVVAKTNQMHAFLLTHFFLRKSKKSYQALVCSGQDQLLASRGGEIESAIDGRPARSRYKVETGVGKHLSRIRIETEQGRRHQVRIHCSDGLRAPILLDPLYGGQCILSTLMKESRSSEGHKKGRESRSLLNKARAAQKICLHASTLTIDALGIDVKAPLPKWWQQLEEELR